MTMNRYYAWDKANGAVVYRVPGMAHGDGRVDSDDSPVWLGSHEGALDVEGIRLEDLEDISPSMPHALPPEYQ